MSASSTEFEETPEAVVREDRLVVDVARIVWRELPILLAVNVACALAGVVVGVLARFSVVALLLAVPVVIGPLAAVAFGVADRLTAGRAASLSLAARLLWSRGLVGARVLLPPGALAAAAYAGLAIPGLPTAVRLGVLVPCGMALTVAAAALPAALSLSVTAGLTGVRRWRSALAVAVTKPMLTLGGLALGVLCCGAVNVFGAGLLIALPAPFAVFCSALTWAAVDRLQAGPVAEPPTRLGRAPGRCGATGSALDL